MLGNYISISSFSVSTINGSQFTAVPNTQWTTYTPTWTAESGAPTIGNGTLSGRYQIIGKTCFVFMYLTIGTTTSISGTTIWRFSLPVTAQSANAAILNATMLRNGFYWIVGTAFTGYGGNASIVTVMSQSGSNPGGQTTSSTTPFTWATTDTLTINGTYETA
jgi:hypothetical protein